MTLEEAPMGSFLLMPLRRMSRKMRVSPTLAPDQGGVFITSTVRKDGTICKGDVWYGYTPCEAVFPCKACVDLFECGKAEKCPCWCEEA